MASAKHRLRFGRERRLRHRRDFERVFRCRCAAADQRLVVHAARSAGGPMRIGIAVGRGYGNAVERNRFKRLIREAFRQQPERWPAGFDVVVRPRGEAVAPTLADLTQSLVRLIPAAVARAAKHRSRNAGPDGSLTDANRRE